MRTNRRQPISPEAAFNKAATLCARCEQAAADVRTKLLNWGLEPSDAETIIERLINDNYLDEQRFARAFVNDKFKFNGWGRMKIAHQLRAKGITSECIDEALSLIDNDEYLATLERILTTKAATLQGREPQQARAALMRFAASRGFEPALFCPIANKFFTDSHDFD